MKHPEVARRVVAEHYGLMGRKGKVPGHMGFEAVCVSPGKPSGDREHIPKGGEVRFDLSMQYKTKPVGVDAGGRVSQTASGVREALVINWKRRENEFATGEAPLSANSIIAKDGKLIVTTPHGTFHAGDLVSMERDKPPTMAWRK